MPVRGEDVAILSSVFSFIFDQWVRRVSNSSHTLAVFGHAFWKHFNANRLYTAVVAMSCLCACRNCYWIIMTSSDNRAGLIFRPSASLCL